MDILLITLSFLIVLIIFAVIGALVITLVKLLLKLKTPREFVQDSKHLIREAKASGSNIYKNLTRSDESLVLDLDEELFSIANSEVETSTRNEGMWVKSLILAEGDKDKQKIEYIKLRVIELNFDKENED